MSIAVGIDAPVVLICVVVEVVAAAVGYMEFGIVIIIDLHDKGIIRRHSRGVLGIGGIAGEVHIHILEIVSTCPADSERQTVSFAAL